MLLVSKLLQATDFRQSLGLIDLPLIIGTVSWPIGSMYGIFTYIRPEFYGTSIWAGMDPGMDISIQKENTCSTLKSPTPMNNWLVVSTRLKNMTSQNGNLPQVGVKIKNI